MTLTTTALFLLSCIVLGIWMKKDSGFRKREFLAVSLFWILLVATPWGGDGVAKVQSLATVPPGLIAIGVLIASDYANPAVIGLLCAAPALIAVPIFAIARLLQGAQVIVPAEQHHHYTGPVSQQHHTVNTQTRGFIAKTIHKQ
jgi:hypothetical protein